MQFDHIINTLDRIRAIVDDCRANGLSELERDAILGELRKVYSAVRFADASHASFTAAGDEAPVVPIVAPAASAVAVPANETEPTPASETETKTGTDTETKTKAETEAETETEIGPEPETETEIGPEPETETETEAEPEKAAAAETKTETAAETKTETAAETKTEAGAETETETETKPETKPETGTAVHEDNGGSRVQSLFDESEIAVNRRRRMIVRSLYDDVLPTESFTGRSVPGTRAASEEPASQPSQPSQSQQSQEPSDERENAESVSISSELIEAPISVTFSHGYAAAYDDEVGTAHSETADEPAYPETNGDDYEDTVQRVPETEEPAPVQMAEPEPEPVQMTESETMQTAEPESVRTADPEPQPEPAADSVLNEEPRPHGRAAADKTDAVLGEVINTEVLTVADTIVAPENLASEVMRHGPALMLEEAIGVNDRFLLIRDLFDGDSEAYARAVAELDSFDNLDDCMLYIVESYDWNPYSEGAKLLMGLIERKYGTRS